MRVPTSSYASLQKINTLKQVVTLIIGYQSGSGKFQIKFYNIIIIQTNIPLILEGTVKLTTLRRSKLTTPGRFKLTTPHRSKMTTLAGGA